jgi:hypothetical protein
MFFVGHLSIGGAVISICFFASVDAIKNKFLSSIFERSATAEKTENTVPGTDSPTLCQPSRREPESGPAPYRLIKTLKQ